MRTPTLTYHWFAALLLGLLLLFAPSGTTSAAFEEPTKTVDGVAAYLGVMSAAIARGHPRQHPEATMHGGPGSAGDRHIVVALFDAKTFDRITVAEITATVEGLAHIGRVTKKLERMDIADAVTFGGYFPFQGTDNYTITLVINLADRRKALTVTFRYQT